MFHFPVDDNIELRLHEEQHAQTLFDLIDDNRDHLRPWFPWVEPTEDVTDSLEFIQKCRQGYADNDVFPTSIWFRDEMAGTFGLFDLDFHTGSGEIGYWLGRKFEGRGIVTRTCRAVLDYAFDDLDLQRVSIRTIPDNTRSAAVAQRLGFTLEGTLRNVTKLHGELRDLEVYSILRREWFSR